MAMVVVLFAVSDGEPKVDPAGLEELAKLGVTSVALLRDSSTAGVVLEGWAFDPRDTRRYLCEWIAPATRVATAPTRLAPRELQFRP